VSFYRDVFQVPTTWAAISVSGIALIFVCGSILGGKIVDKYGRKRLAIISTTLMGLFIILYLNASDFLVSLFLSIGASFFGSILLTAYNNLNLEQVPNFRGTMMSLEIVAASIGVSLGAALGGMTLLWFNWSMLGLVLGLIGVISSIVYLLFTVDPIKTNTS
jgi:predicted MFS family arabinose efflux permease